MQDEEFASMLKVSSPGSLEKNNWVPSEPTTFRVVQILCKQDIGKKLPYKKKRGVEKNSEDTNKKLKSPPNSVPTTIAQEMA